MRTVTKVSSNSQFFDWGIRKTFYSNAVKSDKFGNVFTSASFSQSSGYGYYYLLNSDTNVFHQIKGDKFIVKYDSLGNLLWNFSFGNHSDWNQENYAFDIDNQGDVIVSSKYINDLFLDTLNLKSNNTKFYAFKLNGKSGKLIWLNEFLVSSSFSTDNDQKITIDNEDNIYVSFLFQVELPILVTFKLIQVKVQQMPFSKLIKMARVFGRSAQKHLGPTGTV